MYPLLILRRTYSMCHESIRTFCVFMIIDSITLSCPLRFPIPVVNQQYSVIVHDEYVMSGNTAILKCVVRRQRKTHLSKLPILRKWILIGCINWPESELFKYNYAHIPSCWTVNWIAQSCESDNFKGILIRKCFNMVKMNIHEHKFSVLKSFCSVQICFFRIHEPYQLFQCFHFQRILKHSHNRIVIHQVVHYRKNTSSDTKCHSKVVLVKRSCVKLPSALLFLSVASLTLRCCTGNLVQNMRANVCSERRLLRRRRRRSMWTARIKCAQSCRHHLPIRASLINPSPHHPPTNPCPIHRHRRLWLAAKLS